MKTLGHVSDQFDTKRRFIASVSDPLEWNNPCDRVGVLSYKKLLEVLEFLNKNAGAIQGLSTIALVCITAVYLLLTWKLADAPTAEQRARREARRRANDFWRRMSVIFAKL